MRTIRQLATEFGVSERQFHRKLDAGDEAARLLLRQEILWDLRNPLICHVETIEAIAGWLRRCDPELSRECLALADKLHDLLKTPTSPWHLTPEGKKWDDEHE